MESIKSWILPMQDGSPFRRENHGIFAAENRFSCGNRAVAVASLLTAIFGVVCSASGMRQRSLIRGLLGLGSLGLSATLIVGRRESCKEAQKNGEDFNPMSWEELAMMLTRIGIKDLVRPQNAKEVDEIRSQIYDLYDQQWKTFGSKLALLDPLEAKELRLEKIQDKWACQDLRRAAGDLLDVAQVVSELTLFHLNALLGDPTSEASRLTRAGQSRAAAIGAYVAGQGNLDYTTYFSLTTDYHWIRAFSYTAQGYESNGPMPADDEIVYGHAADPFYQAGTIQNGWRCAYNAWCKRAGPLLPHFKCAPDSLDMRYGRWSMPDTSNTKASFTPTPDTQPT